MDHQHLVQVVAEVDHSLQDEQDEQLVILVQHELLILFELVEQVVQLLDEEVVVEVVRDSIK